ncbi:hypothetical protein E4634_19305 [Mangrovimicrobium sediminis]|uniref:DUF1145 domain-containing protein n=1 Tax=Mangrovimicrobium sediminis TaxID=2562682 RepID=A0A4Z0LVW5_9GAMM|nr:hypothetical protein [Haliea sp. SAOS-164]TGD71419.1 hypothetical protein E4634_19305 [Haliea sp. SAOS-164]
MSFQKLSVLALWLVFLVLFLVAGDPWREVGKWGLVLSVLAHGLEMFLFFGRCKRAGGSLPWHLFQVFLFGILHARELPEVPAGEDA